MDINLLKTSYAENPAVQAICDHMAMRNNNQNETKLHRIIQHLQNEAYEFKRTEIIAAFRKLEEAGMGKYVEGRHGWPSRFIWESKSLYISVLATDGEVSAQELATEAQVSDDEAELIEHSFVLRPDLLVTIELPSDLSAKESVRLAAFIQALPFSDD